MMLLCGIVRGVEITKIEKKTNFLKNYSMFISRESWMHLFAIPFVLTFVYCDVVFVNKLHYEKNKIYLINNQLFIQCGKILVKTHHQIYCMRKIRCTAHFPDTMHT